MYHESDLEEFEYDRYKRQVIVPSIGIEGQVKLRNSKVLVVGCGGLGCAVIPYLSGSGISTIGIIDYDKIEKHNLQRQVLFKEKDISKYKVEIAGTFIKQYNPNIDVNVFRVKIDNTNCNNIINKYDVILDCSDNIQTRYILTDSCSLLDKDFICASVLRWEGHLYVLPKGGSCYRCIYPILKKSTASCDDSGIMGPLCGLFGSLQALETIKLILGKNNNSKMIYYNGFTNQYSNFKLRNRNENCKCNSSKVKDFQDTFQYNKPSTEIGCSLDLEDPNHFKKEASDVISWDDVLRDRKTYTILDVRSPLHFQMLRIKDSYNIEFYKLEDNLEKISKLKNIVITCKRGINSKKAVDVLKSKGIKALSIIGGMNEYESRFIDNREQSI